MIKTEKLDFKSLKQLAMSDKMRLMKDPYYGQRLMSMLTPTEISELFPKYYMRQIPDIGGFRTAMPTSMTSQKQAQYDRMMGRQTASVGGGVSYGGGGAAAPASGNLAQNQREAYAAARAEGLSDTAAKALVANMRGEGLSNPANFKEDYNARGQFAHMQRGIVAWDPPRSEAIRNHFGKYPNEMSVGEQTRAAIWEMKTNPKFAPTWQALNSNASGEQMIYQLVSNYERPAHTDAEVARRSGYFRSIGDGINQSYDPKEAQARARESEMSVKGVKGLEAVAGSPNMQQRSAEAADQNTLFQQAGQIAGVNMRQTGTGGGYCAKGVRGLAGAMFSNPYFANGIGGDATAASLSRGNGYFQSSGLYNNPHAPQGDLSDPNYRASLPIGTVVSAAGGNAKGEGHVQIKIGPGPNDWASDFNQGSKGVLVNDRYHDYMIHTPNEKGQAILAQKNFPTVSDSNFSVKTGDNPNPVGADTGVMAQNSDMSQQMMGGDTASISPMGIPGVPGMGMMGGMMNGEMNPMMMMGMMTQMMGGMGGMGAASSIAGMAMPIAMQAFSALASSNLMKSNEGEGVGAAPKRRKVSPIAKYKDIAFGPGPTPEYRPDLGRMSEKYESGGKGVHSISSGKGDPKGGVSYGAHQLSSKAGSMKQFLQSKEGSVFADQFKGLQPGTPAFSKVYRNLTKEGSSTRTAMEEAQNKFIQRTHYEPIRRVAEHLGYNVKDPRVQETLYSMAVQHRYNTPKYLENPKALASIGKSGEEQAKALFEVRSTTRGLAKFAKSRYAPESKDILAMDIGKYNQPMQYAQAEPSTPRTTPTATTPMAPAPAPAPAPTPSLASRFGLGGATAAPVEAAPAATTQLTPPSATTPSSTPSPYAPVTPRDKQTMNFAIPPTLAQSSVSTDISAVRGDIAHLQTKLNDMQPSTQATKSNVADRDPNQITDLMNVTRVPYQTPAMERAMDRVQFGGDPHHTYGNNS